MVSAGAERAGAESVRRVGGGCEVRVGGGQDEELS